MEQQSTNIFRRDDTFFGVCHAIGEDFGINPNWVRIAFTLPLFFLPIQTIAAYLALGVVVLVSRWRNPVSAAPAQSPVVPKTEQVAAIPAETAEPTPAPAAAHALALAA